MDGHTMLEAFASVGAYRYDFTALDINGEKKAFRRVLSLGKAKQVFDAWMCGSTGKQNSVIVRPYFKGCVVQLDDIGHDTAAKLQPYSFLTIRTSDRNYQAWVAIGDGNADIGRRLRKGIGADLNASGAARMAGTSNFKPKYAPAFPVVRMIHAQPSHTVTTSDLAAMLAPEEKREPRPFVERVRSSRWPEYQRCIDNAPASHDGSHPDVSRADYLWCRIAAQWGHGTDAITAKLMEVSAKAKERPRYANTTAKNAVRAVEERGR
jgi:hypothetical protein